MKMGWFQIVMVREMGWFQIVMAAEMGCQQIEMVMDGLGCITSLMSLST